MVESVDYGSVVEDDAHLAWSLEKRKGYAQQRQRWCKARRIDLNGGELTALNNTGHGESMTSKYCSLRVIRISQDLAREIAEFASYCME
jgi:hypothetical protein